MERRAKGRRSFQRLGAVAARKRGPQRPASYDFGRDLCFQGIGASGFAMGAIGTREPPASGGFALRYAAVMQSLRDEWCGHDDQTNHHVLIARRLLIDLVGGECAQSLREQFAWLRNSSRWGPSGRLRRAFSVIGPDGKA